MMLPATKVRKCVKCNQYHSIGQFTEQGKICLLCKNRTAKYQFRTGVKKTKEKCETVGCKKEASERSIFCFDCRARILANNESNGTNDNSIHEDIRLKYAEKR